MNWLYVIRKNVEFSQRRCWDIEVWNARTYVLIWKQSKTASQAPSLHKTSDRIVKGGKFRGDWPTFFFEGITVNADFDAAKLPSYINQAKLWSMATSFSKEYVSRTSHFHPWRPSVDVVWPSRSPYLLVTFYCGLPEIQSLHGQTTLIIRIKGSNSMRDNSPYQKICSSMRWEVS